MPLNQTSHWHNVSRCGLSLSHNPEFVHPLSSLVVTISGSPIQHWQLSFFAYPKCWVLPRPIMENPASIILTQSNSGPQLSLIELISNLASRLGVQILSLVSSGNWQFQQLVAYTGNIALEWVHPILIVWIPPKCLSRVHDLEVVFILQKFPIHGIGNSRKEKIGDIEKSITNCNLTQTLIGSHSTSMRRAQISSTNKTPFQGPTTGRALQGHDSTVLWLVLTVSSQAPTRSANEEKDKWF